MILIFNKGSAFVWLIFGISVALFATYFGGEYLKEDNIWFCEGGVWVKRGSPTYPRPTENCPTESSSGKFNKTGVIFKDNGENYWSFSYEEPSLPKLRVRLSFDSKSICKIGRAIVTCEDNLWPSGSKAEVSGIKDGNVVRVGSLVVF